MVGTEQGVPRRRKSRGPWIAAGLAAVIVGLVVYWLHNTKFQWGVFFSTFRTVNWWWLSGSLALLLFTYVVRALRWEVMLWPLRPEPSLWHVTSATVIGFTAIVLLGRPGEVVRPYLISVKERVTFSSQMAAWALERIFDMMAVLLIFGIALARISPDLHLKDPLQWILRVGGYFIASIGTACVVLLVAFRSFAIPAKRRILGALSFLPQRIHARVEKIVTAFIEGMKCTHDPRYLALLVGYTVLLWAVIIVGYWCLFHAVSDTAAFGLDNVMIFLGFIAFGSMVQLPGIGGGIQAAATLVLTGIFHVKPEEHALGIAMLIWLLSFVAAVPFGLAFAFHDGVNWKKIRHIQEEAEPIAVLPPTAHHPPPP